MLSASSFSFFCCSSQAAALPDGDVAFFPALSCAFFFCNASHCWLLLIFPTPSAFPCPSTPASLPADILICFLGPFTFLPPLAPILSPFLDASLVPLAAWASFCACSRSFFNLSAWTASSSSDDSSTPSLVFSVLSSSDSSSFFFDPVLPEVFFFGVPSSSSDSVSLLSTILPSFVPFFFFFFFLNSSSSPLGTLAGFFPPDDPLTFDPFPFFLPLGFSSSSLSTGFFFPSSPLLPLIFLPPLELTSFWPDFVAPTPFLPDELLLDFFGASSDDSSSSTSLFPPFFGGFWFSSCFFLFPFRLLNLLVNAPIASLRQTAQRK